MRPPDTAQGFTLIEILVALAILSIALGALLSAMLANASLNTKVDRTAEAVRVSENLLEGYRQTGEYGSLRGQKVETVTRRNQTFTVSTDFCPLDAPNTMPCSGAAVYIRLKVDYGNATLHRVETYYTNFGKE